MASDVFEVIVNLRRERVPSALATVVAARGSTPAKVPSRMVICQDGRTFGTVGGGCVEADVIQAARHAIDTGVPRSLKFHLSGEEAERTGIACGGIVEIMVEPLEEPRVVIVGAGHVGQAVARLAALAGFRITVVDDRPDFANTERFPEADEVIVCEIAELGERTRVGSQTYVLIMTRAHAFDFDVLRWALGTVARYVGVLGSKSKRLAFAKELESLGQASAFQDVHMPIGLDLGAETVGEIAIAIVAELVSKRRRTARDHA